MAEDFNEYFVKIGPTLAGNIQPIDGDHLAYITNRPADSILHLPMSMQFRVLYRFYCQIRAQDMMMYRLEL